MNRAVDRIVVIGAGLAGAGLAGQLRGAGFEGSLTLAGAEADLPYHRPPLSKTYLAGTSRFDDALVHPAGWYRDRDIDLRLCACAVGLDPAGHRVWLAGGTSLAYDKLALATGSTPRRLRLPGADAANVLTLRTRADADTLRARLSPSHRLAIVGAGWIGLEVAAAARAAGSEVTVLERSALPLLAVLGPGLARVFAGLHREHGVRFCFDTTLKDITTTNGQVTGLRLGDGTTLAADTVLAGIGAAPNTCLAAGAGLAVDNGVLVDETLRSSDPDIYALGDIANHDHPVLGRRVRVEHWATALNQPATAAAAMLGHPAPYTELPYFYSDQYDLSLEYLGYVPPGADARLVIRGDQASREFTAFWIDTHSRILAVMAVNTPGVIDEVKPYIATGQAVTRDDLSAGRGSRLAVGAAPAP